MLQRYYLRPNSDLIFVHAAKFISGMVEVSLMLNTLQYPPTKPEYSKEKREGKLRYKHAQAKNFPISLPDKPPTSEVVRGLSFGTFF